MLDSLDQSGLEFAVLHGEEAIAAGEVGSDLDVVVGTHPIAALEQVSRLLESAGVRPVMVWDYDVGDTATVFLATEDASEGVQLDLMYDPRGIGKYGAKTGPMLASRAMGARWPVVGAPHRIAYLVRKRDVKQDPVRLSALVSQAREIDPPVFSDVVNETFSPKVAASILDLVAGRETGSRVPFPFGYQARNNWRRVTRVLKPTGFWVEIVGESGVEGAHLIAGRFQRFLPIVEVSGRPGGGLAQMSWLWSTVAPVRWRAGLLVTWIPSSNRRWPRGDFEVQTDGLRTLCERVVEAMNQELSN